MNGVGDLKNALTSDMEMQSLKFALVQYFLTVCPSLYFGMVMYTLHHCMFKVCDLLSDFKFTGHYNKDIA